MLWNFLLTGFSKIAKWLYSSLDECFQYFCDIQWLSDYRISVTTFDWMIAEFLQHPVFQWSQNFWDTLWLSDCRISVTSSGCRISVTTCDWVIAEFLQHPVVEWLQNFCNKLWVRGRRISTTTRDWVSPEIIYWKKIIRSITSTYYRLHSIQLIEDAVQQPGLANTGHHIVENIQYWGWVVPGTTRPNWKAI